MFGADVLAAVEAAYDLDAGEEDWLRALASRLAAPFGATGVAGFCVSLGDTPQPRSYVEAGVVPSIHRAVVSRGHPEMPDVFKLDGMYRSLGIGLASELLGDGPENWAFVKGMFQRGGFEDCAALLAYDGMTETAAFTSYITKPSALTRRSRAVWRRIATHVSAGLRLRRRLQVIARVERIDHGEAVLRPDGRIAHASEVAANRSAREGLREAVRAADRARAKLRHADPERALELWRGLVAGRWSLLDHFDSDGRRFVVAFRNDPEPASWRRLSETERQVIEYASLGLSNKEIAYALGRGVTTVSTHVGSGLRKLGGLSRTALCTLAGELAADAIRPRRRATSSK